MNSIKRAKKRKIIKILTGVTLYAIMNHSCALDTGGGLPGKEKKTRIKSGWESYLDAAINCSNTGLKFFFSGFEIVS